MSKKRRAGRKPNLAESLIRKMFYDDMPRREIKTALDVSGFEVSRTTLSMRTKKYRSELVNYGRDLMEKEKRQSRMNFSTDFTDQYHERLSQRSKLHIYGLKLNSERKTVFEHVHIAITIELEELSESKNPFSSFFKTHRNISVIVMPEIQFVCTNDFIFPNQQEMQKLLEFIENRSGKMGGVQFNKHVFFEESVFRFNNYHLLLLRSNP